MKKMYYVVIFYILLFGYLFFNTLNTNYVEGDDASTILYHLCGRSNVIQMPYAAYNSGFDFLLKYLPFNDEVVLRETAVYTSFLFGFLVLISIYFFFQEVVKNEDKNKLAFLVLLPFILPQLIFQSLLLNSTNISFTFALIALIFYIKYLKKTSNKYLIISIIFMGLSLPFRWSMITFYPVFVSFYFVYNSFSYTTIIKLIKHMSFFSLSSLLLGFLLIYVTGYTPLDLINIFLSGKQYMENSDRSILSVFAMSSAYLTPQLILLLLFGFYICFKKYYKKINIYLVLLFPLIPYFILGFFPDLKYTITLLPLILLLSYKGYVLISNSRFLKVSFVFSIICMWFIGITINLENSMFGPSFAFKSKTDIETKNNIKISEKNTDKRVEMRSIKASFEGGVYMPTAEGGRPLYGFFYVLFQNGWFDNIEEFKKGRDFAIQKVISDEKIILLQDRKTAFLQADLFRNGFSTSTSFKLDKFQKTYYRDFINDSKLIKLQVVPDGVDKNEFISEFLKNNKKVLFRSSYSSLIMKILKENPDVEFIDIYTLYKK